MSPVSTFQDIAPATSSIQGFDAAIPRLVLEVCSGKTSFPRRPVVGPEFLIGAGKECDLRLGGKDFPVLHSRIRILDEGVRLDVLAPAPTVAVNGNPSRGEWLRDGDLLQIGLFQFLVRMPHLAPAESKETQPEATCLSHAIGMTAEQLVDQLEQEFAQLEELEHTPRQGWHDLLSAVDTQAQQTRPGGKPFSLESRQPTIMDQPWSPTPQPAGFVELSQQLAHLAWVLDQQQKANTQHEVTLAAASELLLTAQQQLASQLDRLTHVLEQLPPQQRRASA